MRNSAFALALFLILPFAGCTATNKQAPHSNLDAQEDGAVGNPRPGSSDGTSPSSNATPPSDPGSPPATPTESASQPKATEADIADVDTPAPSEPASAHVLAQPETTSDGTVAAPARPTAVANKDETNADQCRESDDKLSLSVERTSDILEQGRLQAKMAGPICKLALKITSKEGSTLVEKTFRYTGPERELRWDPIPRDQIEKVEVRVTAKNGAYQSVFLIPWSVTIPHEEVRFDTNKAAIRDSELNSLVDSLERINDVLATVEGKGLGTITLFIAGHTDTQGSDEHNMVLSRNRAQSIASWFMKKGLCIPIAYEGFGESALKKLTADNVDEQANRRVDYILAVEPPSIKKGAAPTWKWLSKGC